MAMDDPLEHRTQQTIGALLRWGVIIAALVVTAGAVVYLVRHGSSTPEYRSFHGEPNDLRSIAGILAQALAGSGRGLIQLGLLLLIGVPIARVAFSLAAFFRQRDYTYVVITLMVLAVLLCSLLGRAG